MLFGVRIPSRTAYSNEELLDNNPNDIAIRCELLGFYFHIKYCFALSSRDPAVSQAHLAHAIWLAQHIPDANIPITYNSHGDPIGYHALVAAWRKQLQSYPSNVAIAYNASRIFSGDGRYFREGIKWAKLALERHPGNERLLGRLKHLRKLASIGDDG
jgi:hypothetical protein